MWRPLTIPHSRYRAQRAATRPPSSRRSTCAEAFSLCNWAAARCSGVEIWKNCWAGEQFNQRSFRRLVAVDMRTRLSNRPDIPRDRLTAVVDIYSSLSLYQKNHIPSAHGRISISIILQCDPQPTTNASAPSRAPSPPSQICGLAPLATRRYHNDQNPAHGLGCASLAATRTRTTSPHPAARWPHPNSR